MHVGLVIKVTSIDNYKIADKPEARMRMRAREDVARSMQHVSRTRHTVMYTVP